MIGISIEEAARRFARAFQTPETPVPDPNKETPVDPYQYRIVNGVRLDAAIGDLKDGVTILLEQVMHERDKAVGVANQALSLVQQYQVRLAEVEAELEALKKEHNRA